VAPLEAKKSSDYVSKIIPNRNSKRKSNSKAIIFDYTTGGDQKQEYEQELQNGHHYIWPLIGAI